ncbi:hypothetical protein HanXRQr2_Chr03g0093841 [Helianthus annuus]|uniref:Uncharacterized protein n=1 Tax=Helianthus annuus TaxID=4232 RepID=A0A9K3JCN5_HELAN|nr:hypothetical protein HanXRQr2_Chr03g0093841 [Helianthus annuus]
MGAYLGGATRVVVQPWRCLTRFVRFLICRSEPKKTQLRRDEAIEEEKVFKGGCPPLSKFDFDFI